jgi:hypothetical protein
MVLTSERGRDIRQEYSEIKEKQVCEEIGLVQVGGSRTKIDGIGDGENVSIKNFSGDSTQVHLTTQNHFIKVLKLNENCVEFVRMFCGNEFLNINGVDRYTIPEIDSIYVNSFMDFLTENKISVIDLIIRNGFDINSVIYRNLKTNELHEITYDEIINRIQDCVWVSKKGGIHLKNKLGKTYFHLQREGKRKKSNRYNVLWHIHRSLFVTD